MGVAGSGKTTLCKEIVRRLSVLYLDNNFIADAFFKDVREGAAYRKFRPHSYEALYRITEENLRLGNSVLLDAPHVKDVQTAEWRTFVKDLARRTKSRLVVIKCKCSEDVLRRRLIARGESRDGWKLRNWNEFIRQEPTDVAVPFPHLVVDTERSLAENTKEAARYIAAERTAG